MTKIILKKKYGSPALANLTGKSMIEKAKTARIKITKPKTVQIKAIKRPLPTYRGSFNHQK